MLCWGGCSVGGSGGSVCVLCWGRSTDGGQRHAEEREGNEGKIEGEDGGKENEEIKEREECHPEGGMEQGNIRGKL